MTARDVPLIHREPQPRPVERHAEDAVLADNRLCDVAVPLVDPRLESLAAQLLLGHAFGRELLLDDVLRGDRGVVRSGKEKDLVPAMRR